MEYEGIVLTLTATVCSFSVSVRFSLTYKHHSRLRCLTDSADTSLGLHLPNGLSHWKCVTFSSNNPNNANQTHTHTHRYTALCLSAAGSTGLYALCVRFISIDGKFNDTPVHSSPSKFNLIPFNSVHFSSMQSNAFNAVLSLEEMSREIYFFVSVAGTAVCLIKDLSRGNVPLNHTWT